MRSIWHNVVAVYSWQARINPGIDVNCNCCNDNTEEIPIHHFYLYPQAQEICEYIQSILHHIQEEQPILGLHAHFTSTQCIFRALLPWRFSYLKIIWISYNSKDFSNSAWHRPTRTLTSPLGRETCGTPQSK